MPDLSMYPENVLANQAFDNPVAFGQAHQANIAQLVDVANLNLLPFDEARQGIAKALQSDDSMHRYWALIVCSSHGQSAVEFAEQAKAISVHDPDRMVRIRAAEFLGLIGAMNPQPPTCLSHQSAKMTTSNVDLNTCWRPRATYETL
jgi:HEAT repeat protein